jgi:hypothetical protein
VTDPNLVYKGRGDWQITGKLDGLDVADLERLQSQIQSELRGWDDSFYEDNMTDAEADADTLASAGWGTDEDYGG